MTSPNERAMGLSIAKMMKKRVDLRKLSVDMFLRVPDLDYITLHADSSHPKQAAWAAKQGAALVTQMFGHDGDDVAEYNAGDYVVTDNLFIVTRHLALTWAGLYGIKDVTPAKELA